MATMSNIESAELCQKVCQKEVPCKAFTWETLSKDCNLMSSDIDRSELIKVTGMVAGTRNCGKFLLYRCESFVNSIVVKIFWHNITTLSVNWHYWIDNENCERWFYYTKCFLLILFVFRNTSQCLSVWNIFVCKQHLMLNSDLIFWWNVTSLQKWL